ncbi:MAG: 4a-hydroxytetrahydrobiopterin dehydratase [Leptolyngbyaceae cyanobacterium SM1_3_5]|nr:4a-hydroxytetrahydrobiopterin dehydratase [Leptolyngbyaceae cyanobacterium SM1_3_5]
MPLLSDRDIQARLAELPNWTLSDRQIESTRRFRDFIEAIAFVNRLVEPAEAAGHHPDITISYNRVTIVLTTHDAGGLTEKDFDLAKTISTIS